MVTCGSCGKEGSSRKEMLVCDECDAAQWCNEKCRSSDDHEANECSVFATATSEHARLQELCEAAEEEGKAGNYIGLGLLPCSSVV